MFGLISMLISLVVWGALVSSEVYALIHAVDFARKQSGGLARKAHIGLTRYEFASVVFHEAFAMAAEQTPAYRFSRAFGVFWGVLAAAVAAGMLGVVAVLPAHAFGAAALVSVGYFGFAYGAAFEAHRAKVNKAVLANSWTLA